MERLRYNTAVGTWRHLTTANHGEFYIPVCTMAKRSAYSQFLGWLNRTFGDDGFARDYMEYSRRLPYNKEDLVVAFTYLVVNSTLENDPVSKYNLLEQLHDRGLDTLGLSWQRAAVAINIASLITNKVYALEPIMQE